MVGNAFKDLGDDVSAILDDPTSGPALLHTLLDKQLVQTSLVELQV